MGLLVLRRRDGVLRPREPGEPGTTLLTLSSPGWDPVVREAEYGARLRDFLPSGLAGRPALVGGFHGSWTTRETLASARVSVAGMRTLGSPLGRRGRAEHHRGGRVR